MKVYLWDQGYSKSLHEKNPHREVADEFVYPDKVWFEEVKTISKLIEGGLPDECEVWELELPED